MRPLDIAIVGAGTAGLAAAIFLSRSRHNVTLYERFDAPKPAGAGLLLQPTGLSVLALLGLDERIIAQGSRIARLYGKVPGDRHATLDVRYGSIAGHLFGLGIHRGSLFTTLYDAVLGCGVRIVPSSEIRSAEAAGGKEWLVSAQSARFGPFDLIVDASGAKSSLRRRHGELQFDRPYPYGALWAIARNDGVFAPDTLAQRFRQATHMMGVLPVGKLDPQAPESVAFFWSLRLADYEGWRARPFRHWQDEAAALWPKARGILSQFRSHEDLVLATYSDTILRRFHRGRLIFIGDAAHCTSPQLGQGANLALMDAMVLAACLERSETLQEALAAYDRKRRQHIRFYQTASRIVTPFFQSDSRILPGLRALACGPACRFTPTQRLAARILSGTKTGWFTHLDPGRWAAAYATA